MAKATSAAPAVNAAPAGPSPADFILDQLKQKPARQTDEFHELVAMNFAKMTPPKTNKVLRELFESGQIVRSRDKEQNQQSGRYTDVWHLPGAENTITFQQEQDEAANARLQNTAVVLGTRLQMLVASKLRSAGVPDDLMAKARPTHQEMVSFVRQSLDDSVRKGDWPWRDSDYKEAPSP